MPAFNLRLLTVAFIAVLAGARPALAQSTAPQAAAPSAEPAAASSEPAAASSEPAAASPEPAAAPPYGAWNGRAPYGPPPALALPSTPPPELEAPVYARRAVELLPELMLGFPQCHTGSLSSARCQGLRGGLGLGVGGLWRVSPYFGLGGTLSALGFGYRPPAQSGLDGGRAAGFFGGILARVYFTESGAFEPYLELALGGGAFGTAALEADGQRYEESGAGGSLRVGGGLEFFLTRHLRLGPALDLTRVESSRLRRCDANKQCVDLDPNAFGHGVGFVTLSCRLTILVGPTL